MTDETTIEPAPAPSTAVAEYSATAAGLAELQSRLKDRAYDLSTGRGMDEAKKDRRELVTLRTSLDKMRKDLNAADRATIAARIELRNSEAERITTAIRQLEDPIDEQIKAEEARKEAEKVAKANAERDRISGIQTRIQALGRRVVALIGKPSGEIAAALDELRAIDIAAGDFAEFADQAAAVRDDAVVKLQQLHDSTKAAEDDAEWRRQETERLNAARAAFEAEQAAARERERLAAEQAEQARLQAEEQARAAAAIAEADQKRVASLKDQIRAIALTPVEFAGKPSTEIAAAAERLQQMPLDGFEEFATEADEVRRKAVDHLSGLVTVAQGNEREQAALMEQQAELQRQRDADAARRAQEAADKAEADRKAREAAEAAEQAAAAQRARDSLAAAEAKMAEAKKAAAVRAAADVMLSALRVVRVDPEWLQLTEDTRDAVDAAVREAETVKPNPIA